MGPRRGVEICGMEPEGGDGMARCESLVIRQNLESIASAGESASTTATTTSPVNDMRYSHLHTSLGVKTVCARK